MAYAFGDDEIKLWVPGYPCPPELVNHINSGGIIVAHNAAFERVIFDYIMAPRFGWPNPKLEQWRCTMAMAYAMAMPGKLEDAAPAAGLAVKKDMTGKRLMLQMSRPRRKSICNTCNGKTTEDPCFMCEDPGFEYTWWDDAERKKRLFEYCKQDVEVERQLEKRLMQLRPSEQKVWELDQRINDRGVYIDDELCLKSLKVVSETQELLNGEMRKITRGEVSSCAAVSALVKWLQARLEDPQEDPFADEGEHPHFLASINKEMLLELLGGWDLEPDVEKVLQLRQ
jgi:DNA polymerase